MEKKYDIVVIGAGSGGLTAAVGFSKVGKKVLLVEREHMGGECTNTGCVPSKALLHFAKTHKNTKPASEAFAYVRNIVNSILEDETQETFKKQGIDVVLGEAVFVDKCSIKVETDIYHYKTAIIATGSAPRMIEVSGMDKKDILTNQNIFNLEEVPKKLLVIGSGPIGMEMAQAFALLGSDVTIATIDTEFAKLEDKAIRPIIESEFAKLGIRIIKSAYINRVENKLAYFDIKENQTKVSEATAHYDKVLIAIGRVPNLPQGLKQAGIESTKYGIETDNQYLTSNQYVYALGDVSQRLKFTHTADDTARQVVTRVVSKGLLRVNNKKAVPKVTYTSPEIAQVGLSHDEAIAKYGEDRIYRIEVSFSLNDRAKTDSNTGGLLVVIAKRLNGTVLGAHIIGPSAGEIISVFTLAIEQKISLWKLQKTIFAYPTYSLVVKKAGDRFLALQLGNLKADLFAMLYRNIAKIIVGLLWLIALGYLYKYQLDHDMTVTETALMIFDFVTGTVWGPILYILAYAIRPLTFFPGTALTILSGVFFGFWTGTLLTIIAANISASLAYGVGKFFGGNLSLEDSFVGNWINALRKNPFESVLTMRMIFLPFDGVSYVAGLLKLPFWSYISATAIGTLLGIATFVSIGASINIQTFRVLGFSTDVIDFEFIVISATVFIASIFISKFLKRWRLKK